MTRTRILILAVCAGCLTGIGAFTFYYGEGLSYFSTDPAACMNCHIMQPQFASWQKSSHHTVATCVDCHLPHDFVNKYIAKAENGYLHSKGFTLQDFPEPIRITDKNSRILQENCISCHGKIFENKSVFRSGSFGASSCVHCHAGVGHGEQVGLGGPPDATETGALNE